ncbi:hypothetical protein L1987_32380 [Smallanthus sonchifolius]|uniref:Uncharacterized protein n=1 Tax=Smallanthus sonchifolius TaxID=185202 RepID=A0ACB9HNY2_9ASTR|nr:hypothetical protein L1987_32380 [Smallanthus sonchifolius]
MSEIRCIIARATSQNLVLIDEICRGTKTAKETCIAGSLIETFDSIDCLGVVSTQLLVIFNLSLTTKHIVNKAMRGVLVNGIAKPTYELIDGICPNSLAFESAEQECLPKVIIQRAEHLYNSVYKTDQMSEKFKGFYKVCNKQAGVQEVTISAMNGSPNQMEKLWKDIENVVCVICDKKLNESSSTKSTVRCVLLPPMELLPLSKVSAS